MGKRFKTMAINNYINKRVTTYHYPEEKNYYEYFDVTVMVKKVDDKKSKTRIN